MDSRAAKVNRQNRCTIYILLRHRNLSVDAYKWEEFGKSGHNKLYKRTHLYELDVEDSNDDVIWYYRSKETGHMQT